MRVRDIARVELGSQDYTINAYLDDKVGDRDRHLSSGPARTRSRPRRPCKQAMEELRSRTSRRASTTASPTTRRSSSSNRSNEVVHTLFEAVGLVVLVMILFLQTWRAAIIPIVAIPVSLIGSFFVMASSAISLNKLTLFGLVLAIGIVVDDAIVVVENVERYLREGMSPRTPRTRPWTRSAAR